MLVSYSPYISALSIYPVKGMRGTTVRRAAAEFCGLQGDRRWMVVDGDGVFLTQRELPVLARIVPTVTSFGLMLKCDGGEIEVTRPPEISCDVTVHVWRDDVPAQDTGDTVAEWLSERLKRRVRLVYLHDPDARRTDPHYAPTNPPVSFADGFPLLITTTASLDDLNRRMDTPVPMTRFRPNITVSGCSAWSEDTWRLIRVGTCLIRVVKPCARCAVTLVDQTTGDKPTPREPLRTLATFRRARRGVMFGQNAIIIRKGTIRVNDPVELLEIAPAALDS